MNTPRFWLIIWGAIGSVLLVYVTISASVKPNLDQQPSFLTGEMQDFTLAFPPRRAPDIPFLHNKEEMTLADFQGKVVLVNFWATWCAPCLDELPSLDRLEGRLGNAGFEVVAIAADPRGPETARAFLDKLAIQNLKLYADPRLLFTSAIGGANVLPVSILYDQKGREIGRLLGKAEWDSPEANRLIQAVIDKQAIR